MEAAEYLRLIQGHHDELRSLVARLNEAVSMRRATSGSFDVIREAAARVVSRYLAHAEFEDDVLRRMAEGAALPEAEWLDRARIQHGANRALLTQTLARFDSNHARLDDLAAAAKDMEAIVCEDMDGEEAHFRRLVSYLPGASTHGA